MGVKGLSGLINKYSVQTKLSDYKNKRFAIDTSIYLYKFKYNSTTEDFLRKFQSQIEKFTRNNITPIYIFDGKSNELKQKTKDTRQLTKVIHITKEDIIELKKLFDDSNIQYYIASSEAEKYCAYLNKINFVDVVLSNDLDTLVFGCKKVLTINKNVYFEYDLDNVLNQLSITNDKLIDLCIASGCDFDSKGISGIGPKKALDLCIKHEIINEWGLTLPENYLLIKDIFTDFQEEEKLFNEINVE
jgi:flap endonuclease-1